jgi:hypothetical protein
MVIVGVVPTVMVYLAMIGRCMLRPTHKSLNKTSVLLPVPVLLVNTLLCFRMFVITFRLLLYVQQILELFDLCFRDASFELDGF